MDISPGKEWTHRIVKWSPVAALLLLSVSGFPEKKFLSSLVIRVGSRRVRNEITISVSQSCLTLCDPLDCSPPGCSVHGISQATALEWVVISFSREFPDPGIEPVSPALAGGFFTTEPPGYPKHTTWWNVGPSLIVQGRRCCSGSPGLNNWTSLFDIVLQSLIFTSFMSLEILSHNISYPHYSDDFKSFFPCSTTLSPRCLIYISEYLELRILA